MEARVLKGTYFHDYLEDEGSDIDSLDGSDDEDNGGRHHRASPAAQKYKSTAGLHDDVAEGKDDGLASVHLPSGMFDHILFSEEVRMILCV